MLLKLILGNPWVFGAIAVVILALAGWGYTEHRLRVAAEKGEAAEHQRAGMWEGQATANAAELKHVRSQLDAMDLKAKEQQALSDRKVSELAKERDAALSRAESFRTELMRKANEPGATAASVGRAALEGLKN